jgi:hypothetical protein
MAVRSMVDLPATAAWRLHDAHVGFEVLFLRRVPEGYEVEGHTTGVEDGVPWGIRYAITLDAGWATRSAFVSGRSALGTYERRLEADGAGAWLVDGEPEPSVAGCLDVDLEASAFTNAFPVRRLALDVGDRADAPAAYVRANDLRVERLEQSYARLPDDGDRSRYDYASPASGFTAELVYDRFGLVLDYPGIAVRVL